MNIPENLIQIIMNNKYKTIAEIGVHKGRTLRDILRSSVGTFIHEYWAIDQWKIYNVDYGKDISNQDIWNNMYRNVCKYMPWFPSLKVLRMSSENASNLFWDNYFDLIFIDANHMYEFVKQDILLWFPKVRIGGILCGHDYGGQSSSTGVQKAVDELFSSNIELVNDDDFTQIWIKRK